MNENITRVMLVDDDEDYYVLMRAFLSDLPFAHFQLDWVTGYDQAMEAISQGNHQVYLIDYRIGEHDGLELLKSAQEAGCNAPIIMLTGRGDIEVDLAAMKAGASSYFNKNTLNQETLESAIRYAIERKQTELGLLKENHELQELVKIDSLTHIANRRRFDEHLTVEWNRMKREQRPLSLIMGDIDFFKLYNDKYGHQMGDACLHGIAQAMQRIIKRPGDLLARYGGEEFAVILPDTTAEGAVYIAKNLLAEVRQLKISHEKSTVSEYVTLSLGVSTIIPQNELSLESLVETADKALYEAKTQGRNRVVMM